MFDNVYWRETGLIIYGPLFAMSVQLYTMFLEHIFFVSLCLQTKLLYAQ